MSDSWLQTPIRIPVKLVDGQWEFFYGGGVPVKPGTVGDLIVQKGQILDKKFLALLRKRSHYRLLDEGVNLLVALTIRASTEVSPSLLSHLVEPDTIQLGADYYSTPRPAETRFVSVWIGPPSDSQKRRHQQPEGGVWLQVAGGQPKGVLTSSVQVHQEISRRPFDSLNHAFTKLSELYEPWRQSHTGNVYTRVLYQEANSKWYPLDVLRGAASVRDEHALMKAHWSRIEEQLLLIAAA